MFPFELDGRQHLVSCVLAGRVIEHLNVVEHVGSRLSPRSVDLASDPLALEQVEEALGQRLAQPRSRTRVPSGGCSSYKAQGRLDFHFHEEVMSGEAKWVELVMLISCGKATGRVAFKIG